MSGFRSFSETEQKYYCGLEAVDVWPEGQECGLVDQYIRTTQFEDYSLYHEALIERALELEAIKWKDQKPESRTLGGRKVHHLDQWDCPEATLINERAKALFRNNMDHDDAHIDLSWANVYRKWDYVIPHSHRMSAASLVYFLDLGDPDPDDPLSGQLAFADPRIDVCCSEEPGYVTTQCYIDAKPGMMLIWPAPFVHFVTPYAGDRPRITLAWNISRYAGEMRDDTPYPNVAPTPTSRV